MYSEIHKSYDELYKSEQLNKFRIILEETQIKSSDKLLDVACGTGLLLDFLDQEGIRCNKTGIDKSEGMLKHCRHHCIHANAESLPFSDKEFDIVTCITALHDFDDPGKAIKEIKRVYRRTAAITVLRAAKRYYELCELIKQHFKIRKTIEEMHDSIFICY